MRNAVPCRVTTVGLSMALTGCEVVPPRPAKSTGGSFYVSTKGDDADPGSKRKPFGTLRRACEVAQPGDTVFLRGGDYAETLAPRQSGLPGAPITFSRYADEKVMPGVRTADHRMETYQQWNLCRRLPDRSGFGSQPGDLQRRIDDRSADAQHRGPARNHSNLPHAQGDHHPHGNKQRANHGEKRGAAVRRTRALHRAARRRLGNTDRYRHV